MSTFQVSKQLPNMSCEQVYNIWITDPDLISLIDLRNASDFETAHIPGARRRSIHELSDLLSNLGNRLAVIINYDHQLAEIEKVCQGFNNCTFLSRCDRWSELKHPTFGQGISQTNKRFYDIFFKGDTMNRDIIFHQLFEAESSTYTYIIADKKTKEAAIIDPVLETVDRDIKLIDELGLKLIYALDTHIHADHITGAGELRKRLGVKTGVSFEAQISCVDIPLEDGQELLLGDKTIKVIATPGHTDTCLTYAFEGMIFTGDALLIRTCGRTDFQQGDPEKLFSSVHDKLFILPDDTIIYPGHDYRGQTSSTIGAEKRYNSRLNQKTSLSEFKKIMSELKLPNPKKIHEAVPANLACGAPKDSKILRPQIVDGIPEMTAEDLFRHMDEVKNRKIRIVDVRTSEEYNNELGHIEGAELVTLGSDLTAFLEKGNRSDEIVFICRSGGRSGTATAESIKLGYKNTINLTGGMIRWNEKKFPVIRN